MPNILIETSFSDAIAAIAAANELGEQPPISVPGKLRYDQPYDWRGAAVRAISLPSVEKTLKGATAPILASWIAMGSWIFRPARRP